MSVKAQPRLDIKPSKSLSPVDGMHINFGRNLYRWRQDGEVPL